MPPRPHCSRTASRSVRPSGPCSVGAAADSTTTDPRERGTDWPRDSDQPPEHGVCDASAGAPPLSEAHRGAVCSKITYRFMAPPSPSLGWSVTRGRPTVATHSETSWSEAWWQYRTPSCCQRSNRSPGLERAFVDGLCGRGVVGGPRDRPPGEPRLLCELPDRQRKTAAVVDAVREPAYQLAAAGAPRHVVEHAERRRRGRKAPDRGPRTGRPLSHSASGKRALARRTRLAERVDADVATDGNPAGRQQGPESSRPRIRRRAPGPDR